MVVLLVVALFQWHPWLRYSSHVETVLTGEDWWSAGSNEADLAELEAAGPQAVDELRAELRRELGWLPRFQSDVLSVVAGHRIPWFYAPRSPRWYFEERKHHALNALLLLGERAAAARPDMEALQARSSEYRGSIATLFAFSPGDPVTISNAVAKLQRGLTYERRAVARNFSLIWTNPPAHLPVLVNALQDSDEHVRVCAMLSLGRYGVVASNALPQLLPLLKDSVPSVRSHAAYLVGHFAPSEAAGAIQTMLAYQRLQILLRTNANWIYLEPYRLFADLGPRARAAVPRLEEELGLPDHVYQTHAGPIAFALWRITGENSSRAVTALSRGAESVSPDMQFYSLRCLKELGPVASNAAPVLRRLAQDQRVLLRRLAQEALQSVTQSTEPAR